MKPNPRACEGIKAALKALFRRLIAREMARAETKRRQSPQLDLDE